MSWAGDKKEVLSKFIDVYQQIDESKNRWDAAKVLFDELDFFTEKLIVDDPVITQTMQVDKDWINAYLSTMSDLMGEEP